MQVKPDQFGRGPAQPVQPAGGTHQGAGVAEVGPGGGGVAGETNGAHVAGRGSGRGSRLGVLRHGHFRNVWLASLVSNTGNWMELVGIQTTVAHATGSLAWMGYLGAASLAPILILGTFGGLVADRVDRRRLLLWTQGILMVLAVGVAVVSLLPWERAEHLAYALIGLSALHGATLAFNMPAWQVLTPRLVPREELTKAITLNGIQFNLARVVGPGLAGGVLAVSGDLGAAPLFVLNAVSFAFVLGAVARTPAAPAVRAAGRALEQVREAWAFIFFGRGPRAIFWAMIALSMLAAPLVRMLAMFTKDVYGLDDAGADRAVGILLSLQGVGAVAGGLALRYLPAWYPKHHFIPAALLGAGLTITLFSIATHQWVGGAVMVVCGVFWIWGFNQSWAAMQNLVADTMRGRVMAMVNVASFGATAAGVLVAGLVGESLKGVLGAAGATQLAIGAMSYLLLLCGLGMLVWRTPEIDGLPRLGGRDMRRPDLSLLNALTAREHRPDGPDRAA